MARALALVVVLAAGIVLLRSFDVLAWVEEARTVLRAQGLLGAAGYALVYAILASLFVPGSVLTMIAGATWGIAGGTAIILPGATLAAVLSAALGRTMLRDLAMSVIERYPTLAALDRVLGRHGLRFIILLRLSPILPFAPSNYALGTTAAPLGAIGLGTLVGLIPITVVWVYFGTLLGDAVTTGVVPDSPLRTALLVLGLAATALVVVWIGKLARTQLQVETNQA